MANCWLAIVWKLWPCQLSCGPSLSFSTAGSPQQQPQELRPGFAVQVFAPLLENRVHGQLFGSRRVSPQRKRSWVGAAQPHGKQPWLHSRAGRVQAPAIHPIPWRFMLSMGFSARHGRILPGTQMCPWQQYTITFPRSTSWSLPAVT